MKACERCDREALADGRWCLKHFRVYVEQAKAARHRAELLAAREREWAGSGPAKRRTRRRVPECGTNSGYMGHRRRGQHPCDPCREAHTAYEREAKARRERNAA